MSAAFFFFLQCKGTTVCEELMKTHQEQSQYISLLSRSTSCDVRSRIEYKLEVNSNGRAAYVLCWDIKGSRSGYCFAFAQLEESHPQVFGQFSQFLLLVHATLR